MANKRTLKRAINGISESLFAECVAASLYGSDNNKENIDSLLVSIVKMQRNFISRVSHPEPGLSPKAYFRDLREKLSADVEEIFDRIIDTN